MAITDTLRGSADNVRALKRYLQGRGINLRQTIVTSDAVYAADRIALPGLKSDDKIISVINWSDGNDLTGALDDEGESATLTVFSANKGIIFTAAKPGEGGNLIYVKAAAAPGASLPLSVDIGPYDLLIPGTGHAGKTVILVNLATNASSVALTDGSNSALKVERAVIDAMGVPPGGNGQIVTMEQTGTGATDWTAQAVVPLVGGSSFDQGAAKASLVADMDPYENANIRYTARTPGVAGNGISVAYTAGGALAVAVSGSPDDNIVVTYVPGVTTAADVIAAVNANAEASALVIATPERGPVPMGTEVEGVIETMVATPLTGGVDGGFKLTEDSSGKKLLVLWASAA